MQCVFVVAAAVVDVDVIVFVAVIYSSLLVYGHNKNEPTENCFKELLLRSEQNQCQAVTYDKSCNCNFQDISHTHNIFTRFIEQEAEVIAI